MNKTLNFMRPAWLFKSVINSLTPALVDPLDLGVVVVI